MNRIKRIQRLRNKVKKLESEALSRNFLVSNLIINVQRLLKKVDELEGILQQTAGPCPQCPKVGTCEVCGKIRTGRGLGNQPVEYTHTAPQEKPIVRHEDDQRYYDDQFWYSHGMQPPWLVTDVRYQRLINLGRYWPCGA